MESKAIGADSKALVVGVKVKLISAEGQGCETMMHFAYTVCPTTRIYI